MTQVKPTKRILFGVTSAQSLDLLGPLPGLLASEGFDVHLVSSATKGSPHGVSKQISWHAIPMKRTPAISEDIRSLLSWVRLLRRLRPSIVSIGTPKAALLGLSAAWFLRIPRRVYVLRGLRLETATGLQRFILHFVEKLTASCATEILSVSASLSSKYVGFGFCRDSKIHVLGRGSSHGVDVRRFTPGFEKDWSRLSTGLGLKYGVPVLGFVGRFSADKGAESLLATRRWLVRRGIDHEFLLVGPVEDSVEVLTAMNSSGRPVKQAGLVIDVENFYPLMTVLLLPTKREGFPNVVLEAAVANVPTIITNVTGATDAVVDEATGVVVKSASPLDFAKSVEHWLHQTGEMRKLGESARLTAVRDFDESKVSKIHLDWYCKVSEEINLPRQVLKSRAAPQKSRLRKSWRALVPVI